MNLTALSLRLSLTVVVAGAAAYGGFWAKSHLATPSVLAAPAKPIAAPELTPLPKITAESVDLVALARQQQKEASVITAESAAPEKQVITTSSSPKVGSHPSAQRVSRTFAPVTSSDEELPPLLTELPHSFVAGLPPLLYSAHVYSSDPRQSYIQLNQQVLHQGDHYAGLIVEQIRYPDTIFRYKGRLVRILALTDWGEKN